MRARFDDLRIEHSKSFSFEGLTSEIVADSLDEVADALLTAEAAAAAGSWVAGYVAYEAAPAFDSAYTITERTSDDLHHWLPLVWFGVFSERRDEIEGAPLNGSYALGEWQSQTTRDKYDAAIGRIRNHIRQGDTYQVNYTMRLRAPFSGDPVAFYHDLCVAQSGGYGAYLDAGRFRILSASPELFFERTGSRLVARPMKGTAARGRWPAEDEALRDQLTKSVKDRAENVMIVDLLRNDIGRIAEFGSVEVERLFDPERYDTVWQLTSTISADIRTEIGLLETFQALFPCGSITGAPKVRTMEIISENEHQLRGVYCGALGYLAPPGVDGPDMAFSVPIRTVVLDLVDGEAEYGVGGGIVYDSSAANEYEEAAVKARVLTRSRSPFQLLETMRWDPTTGVANLDLHLKRMASSASYFGYPFDEDAVRAALHTVENDSVSRLRLLLDRSGQINVERRTMPAQSKLPYTVRLESEPVDTTDPFLFHKTTMREIYDVRRVRNADVDDAILVNERGEVTESTIANVLVLIGGKWLTPPVESGCLAGVGRQVLIGTGQVSEAVVAISDFLSAESIELVNSLRGRWQVDVSESG